MTDAGRQPPLDEISICDLRFRCVVGINEEERREKQDVVAQITHYVDLHAAGRTDAIEDTVDYKALKKEVLTMAERSRFRLVEALAQRIADLCLRHTRVKRVAVVVEKPGALRFARTVAVKIVRDKNSCDE
jgi:D-erythro-7,8-dihydroneopterin triphosphate epimerase